MNDVIFRPASAADAASLADLGRRSFDAAFAHLYRPEDLAAFHRKAYAPSAVRREIDDPAIVHRLAEVDGLLVAYCKLADPSGYAGHSDAIHPIALNQLYTDPAWTGRGLGAELMRWTRAETRRRGGDAIQLSVWSGNFGAQRFYGRHGFAKIADIDFWVGTHRDDEYLYELRLGESTP